MISTVKLDKKYNYLLDTVTGEIIDRYDPLNKNLELVLTLDNSTLKVDSCNIKQEYGGQVIVQYNDDRYIIDDGYQCTLLKSGYIVFKEYDTKRVSSYDKGVEIKSNIINNIRKHLPELSEKYNEDGECIPSTLFYDGNESKLIIGNDDTHYKYIIRFNTVDKIVNYNHQRKDNNLTFYPFEKSMDKFGSIYVSIFAQKNHKDASDQSDKYTIPDTFIRELIQDLGIDYHYISLPIKSRMVYWPSL